MPMMKWPRHNVMSRGLTGNRLLMVYQRNDRLGVGTCMSLYEGRREALRFDLFDPAHMHIADEKRAPRHYYPQALTFAEYVDLALADLQKYRPMLTEPDLLWAKDALLG